MVEIGIALSIACAAAGNVAMLCKHRGAQGAPPVSISSPLRSAVELFRSRWWTIGFVLAAIAFRYAVAPAIEAAIKKTGKADRKAIRDALEEVDVANTPVGRVKFDDTHQAFINMLLVQIDNGQLKVLEKIPIQP